MTTSRRPSTVLGAGLAVSLSLTLSACAPPGLAIGPADGSATAAPTARPTLSVSAQSPSPSVTAPAPQPAAEGSDLKPGTNHSHDADSYVYPAASVERWLQGGEQPREKVVFLTFDDGPNPSTTPRILKALREGEAHATFFVIGREVAAQAALLKQEVAEGHSIGLHSFSHDYRQLYPHRSANPDRIAEEISRSMEALRSVFGAGFSAQSWRYPGGHMSWRNMAPADKVVHAQGLHWIDWNADSRDSAPKSERPRTVAAMTAEATKPIAAGQRVAVVLCHDTPDKRLTAEAVPAIIEAYRRAGYRFGVIS